MAIVKVPEWADIFIITDTNWLSFESSHDRREGVVNLQVPGKFKIIIIDWTEDNTITYNTELLAKDEELKPTGITKIKNKFVT